MLVLTPDTSKTKQEAKENINQQRRSFLQKTGAALIIGAYLPGTVNAAQKSKATSDKLSEDNTFEANAFVKVAKDNTVTVLIKHIEFGQGPFTGLATLVAEEMDADWSQIRAEHAPADSSRYKNNAFGIQGTGGSTAIANSFIPMRKAGAKARAMLVAAAAELWQVPASEISVSKGVISHKGKNKQARFGELVEKAAGLSLENLDPPLKKAEAFTLIGKDIPRLDVGDKSNGKATFTLDVYKKDMLTAMVAHPPVFGATLKDFDATQAQKVKGVKAIKRIPQGVAVYATNTYAAKKARDMLKINWDTSTGEQRSSKTLLNNYFNQANTPGAEAAKRGDISAAEKSANKTIEAEYSFPYLAHAPMEPLDAVILFKDGQADAWFGSQLQTVDQGTIAAVLGIDASKVKVHTMLAGGSFGRRAQPDSGFAAEAAAVVKALGQAIPVKLVWTREDDIRGGRYRPLTVHKIKGSIDKKGNITSWNHNIASQSILAGSPFEGMIQNGIDATTVEGANDMPYTIPNFFVGLHTMQAKVPVLWWRSVGHTHTAYAVETFVDQLLEAGDKDPIEGRLALLKEHPRESNVLKKVASMAESAGKAPKNHARGVAVHKSFNSYVAQIAELTKGGDGLPKVTRVWCAVDCGLAINKSIVEAQMESGIGYGLGAILYDQITIKEGGEVAQSNFHDYRSLRINEMPSIEVSIIPSAEAPTGVGEPGTPPIGPAVANAWRRLTGKSVTHLPFSGSEADTV